MEPEQGNCTLMFVNSTNISIKEVEELFSKFTNNLTCTESDGRIYVKLDTEQEAEKAVECLSSFINLSRVSGMPANSRLRDNLPHNQLNAHSTSSTSLNHFDQCSSVKTESGNNSYTDSSSLSTATENLPQLMDMKNIKKIYPIIVANLPGPFTLENVLNLVEESEPIAVTQLSSTEGEKLKYCEIYLKSLDDVRYLKNKLDRFVICGKKLMVVEPNECLDGCRWML